MLTIPATRVEISLSAIRHNITQLRSILTPGSQLLTVVKSNAYGHGLAMAPYIADMVDLFGVVNITEALRLRDMGIKNRIVVLGATTENTEWQLAQEYALETCVFNANFLEHLSPEQPPIKVHIKINTGLNRLGIVNEQFADLIGKIESPLVKIQGIFSHLADAESQNPVQTKNQINVFNNLINSHRIVTDKLNKHIVASAGTILFPEAHFDLVRVGISLYGIWPSPETQTNWKQLHPTSNFDLRPALKYLTKIVCIQETPAGSPIGYDGTYTTTQPSRIASVPVGYYEGIPRELSNKATVIIHGTPARVVGNVCMNMCMVDITHIPSAVIGSNVTIISDDAQSPASAQRQSDLIGNIPYVLLSNIPSHIPRVYID